MSRAFQSSLQPLASVVRQFVDGVPIAAHTDGDFRHGLAWKFGKQGVGRTQALEYPVRLLPTVAVEGLRVH